MRIGVIGPVFPDSFADNIVDSLRHMGHEALAFGPATSTFRAQPLARLAQLGAQASRSVERGLQGRVVCSAKRTAPDVVISVDGSLLPGTVEAIHDTGARLALWFPDALSNLDRQLMYTAGYDLVCFKDPVLVERCRQLLSIPVHYLPEACNPSWHYPPTEAIRDPVIVVAGNMYPARISLLERLTGAGVPLKIFGPAWSKWLKNSPVAASYTGRYIARGEKAAVFRSAAAVLNTLHPSEMESVNCRLFEAAGCGGAVLTEYRSEVDRFFEGDEVVAFSSFDELVDRARVLLSDGKSGRSLGDRACARAHRDHTYAHRLSELLATLG